MTSEVSKKLGEC